MRESDLETIARIERGREGNIEQSTAFEKSIQPGSLADIQQKYQSGLTATLDSFEAVTNPELKTKIEQSSPHLSKILEWFQETLRYPNAHTREIGSYIREERLKLAAQKEEVSALKMIGEDVGSADEDIAEKESLLNRVEKFANRITGKFEDGNIMDPVDAINILIDELH